MYNIISCSGWSADAVATWVGSGPCIKARLGLVILFFIIAIVRKWGAEEWGFDFSFLGGLIFGFGGYFLVVTIFGTFKWALLVGIIGSLVGGYGGGMFFGGGEEY